MAILSAVSIKEKDAVTDTPWSKEDEDDQAACLLLLGNVAWVSTVFDQLRKMIKRLAQWVVSTVFDQLRASAS